MPMTRRQREVLDFVTSFTRRLGYAPSFHEIAQKLGIRSVSTVHKHVQALVARGAIQHSPDRPRSLSPAPSTASEESVMLPLLGVIAAGLPLEAIEQGEEMAVPRSLAGRRRSYVLSVRGDSMIDESIRDGDFIIVEEREDARNGELVVALVNGAEVTLKRFYREKEMVRLQPANAKYSPILVPARSVKIQGIVVGLMRKY